MNRTKHPQAKKHHKKMQKEIRLAQVEYPGKAPKIMSNELKPEDLIKTHRKKVAIKEESLLKSAEKMIRIKKEKRVASHSKRTTPGQVQGKISSPQHIHQENERWAKTLNMQNKAQAKVTVARLGRSAGKKGR